MFYLYLVILSLAEIYFFNSIKSIISGGQVILGDLLFSMVCVGLALFMVLGALHVKHLNKDWLKKFGLGVIAIGALILSGSILSFNLTGF